jgi:hypothetical protein
MFEPVGSTQTLEEWVLSMRATPADRSMDFHALTLSAHGDGQITLGMHTQWVGYDDRHVELRKSRVVDASHAEAWERAELPYVFVTCEDHLIVFLLMGGNALVERRLAEAAFPHVLEVRPAYNLGRFGFVGANLLKPGVLRRAPTPKMRMAVLQRDRRRCRICGRRPDDNVDIELHVHHIRPWDAGGITDPSNLITLCNTCHKGLNPHFDHSLFEYVEQGDAITSLRGFAQEVANYQRLSMCNATSEDYRGAD